MSLYDLTSNQYYNGLNRRFDARVRRILGMGFAYNPDAKTYFRRNKWNCKSRYGLTLSQIMHCDHRAWNEELASATR